MTLQSLKEDYKKTFSEPRLSGRFLPKDYSKELYEKIDNSKTLEEFIDVISNLSDNPKERIETTEQTKNRRRSNSYHILSRILTWNDEPPVDENGNRYNTEI